MKTVLVKIKQALTSKPKIVSVRYNNDDSTWSILDDKDNPTENFKKGFLTDVTFRTRRVEENLKGCGVRHENIGIATGTFIAGTFKGSVVGFRNLSFNDSIPSFIDADGKELVEASVVRLMDNRKALVRE